MEMNYSRQCITSHFELQMDLGIFINKSGCECLNESDDHHLSEALTKGPGCLESDCDEQVQYFCKRQHNGTLV